MAYTRTAVHEIEWQCCQCGREVIVGLNDNHCPDCSHERCCKCKAPRNPTPIRDHSRPCGQSQHITHIRARPFELPYQHWSTSHVPTCSSVVPFISLPRPPLQGWWECCQCNNPVNPAVSGNECPVENHTQCNWCKVY